MFVVPFISRLSNNFCSQVEKGVYWMKHALCAFKQPVPAGQHGSLLPLGNIDTYSVYIVYCIKHTGVKTMIMYCKVT